MQSNTSHWNPYPIMFNHVAFNFLSVCSVYTRSSIWSKYLDNQINCLVIRVDRQTMWTWTPKSVDQVPRSTIYTPIYRKTDSQADMQTARKYRMHFLTVLKIPTSKVLILRHLLQNCLQNMKNSSNFKNFFKKIPDLCQLITNSHFLPSYPLIQQPNRKYLKFPKGVIITM